MNDPAAAEAWQTAFGKDFGCMLQGDDKMGQKGSNAMFVMTHEKIRHILATGQKFTYGNPVINIDHKMRIHTGFASQLGAI